MADVDDFEKRIQGLEEFEDYRVVLNNGSRVIFSSEYPSSLLINHEILDKLVYKIKEGIYHIQKGISFFYREICNFNPEIFDEDSPNHQTLSVSLLDLQRIREKLEIFDPSTMAKSDLIVPTKSLISCLIHGGGLDYHYFFYNNSLNEELFFLYLKGRAYNKSR